MKPSSPLLHGLWQLFWRSVVLLPVAAAVFTAYLAVWVAVLLLPVVGVYWLCTAEWLRAAVADPARSEMPSQTARRTVGQVQPFL